MAKLIIVVLATLLIGAYGQQNDANNTTPAPPTTTPAPTTPAPTTPAPTTPAPTTPEPTTPEPTTPEPTTPEPTTPEPPTTAPPTTTPAPPTDEFFRVTEDNITCVMYGGDISFSVSFKQTSGKIGHAVVSVPQPNKEDVSTTGSCNALVAGMQYINVTWGPTNAKSSFQLEFNETSGSKWMLTNVAANLFLDEATFLNVTDAGKYLLLAGEFPGLNNVAVDTNSSLTCRAAVDSKNFSAEVIGSTVQGYTATANAVGIKLQAFNSIPNMRNLQQGMRCEADITSDLVPIAVGCALAGLVLLVLISYLVGRRRRAAAYQSV